MRIMVLTSLLVVLLAVGCAGRKLDGQARPAPGATGSPIITPSSALVGKVISYVPQGRFVVLSFPIGRLPQLDQRLNVYRQGLKVGEVKVTGPQRDDTIVADVSAGDAAAGDEVRDR